MGETSTGCKGYCCYREPEGDHCPARPYGQRAILKFAQYNGAHPIAGRHTPGTFTNQLQTSFGEPLLIILTDPRTDHQQCSLPSDMEHNSMVPLRLWLPIYYQQNFCVAQHPQVDQFFYRDTEEAKEHEEEEVVAATDYGATDFSTAAICLAADQWSGQISDAQWGAEVPAAAAVPSLRWDPGV